MKAEQNFDKSRMQARVDSKKSVMKFIGDVKDEIKKVTWPQADELRTCTKLVIGATFIFGLVIFVADLMIKGSLDGISFLFKSIFG